MPIDNWEDGSYYERFMGRWSKPLAVEFLKWLDAPNGLKWLEIGCGTGSLTGAILRSRSPQYLLAIDPSQRFVEYSNSYLGSNIAEFKVANADQLPSPSNAVDIVVSGLVLNFIPDTTGALQEMRRVLVPAGSVCGYVWDYAGKMEMLRLFWDAAASVFPDARGEDEGIRFPLCDPENLSAALEGAGLKDVSVEPISIQMDFHDFEDYWGPFLGGQGPAPSFLQNLGEEGVEEIHQELLTLLPIQQDGTISLVGQAWAFKGEK